MVVVGLGKKTAGVHELENWHEGKENIRTAVAGFFPSRVMLVTAPCPSASTCVSLFPSLSPTSLVLSVVTTALGTLPQLYKNPVPTGDHVWPCSWYLRLAAGIFNFAISVYVHISFLGVFLLFTMATVSVLRCGVWISFFG